MKSLANTASGDGSRTDCRIKRRLHEKSFHQ